MHILVLLYCLPGAILAWDLSELDIQPGYYVSDIAIYRNRAFLALPRGACQNNVHQKTFIEVPWTGEHFGMLSRRKLLQNLAVDQEYSDCDGLQDVVALDTEPRRPRLWVLDRGNAHCAAKVAGYNLLQNAIIYSTELNGVPPGDLNTLVVDPEPGDYGTRMYIGDAGDNTILVFSATNMNWWKVKLVSSSPSFFRVPAGSLAVSKNEPVMYISGVNGTNLFSVELSGIRKSEDPLAVEAEDIIYETNVTYLGEKLGPSTGLVTDLKFGLSYYLIRDYAVMRWNTRASLIAEYHDVLAQSYDSLPYVSQLFIGPQNGIWALVNPSDPHSCGASEDTPQVETRVVKIMKYNRREKKILL